MRHVEAPLHHRSDDVAAKICIGWMAQAALWHVAERCGFETHSGPTLIFGRWRIVNRLSPVDAERRHILVVERFVLVVANDHTHIWRHTLQRLAKMGDRRLACLVMCRALLVSDFAFEMIGAAKLIEMVEIVRVASEPELGIAAV